MKAFKALNNDWTCNSFKFEVGKEYEHPGTVKMCESGFHACISPADILKYYDLIQYNKFAEVECEGVVGPQSDCSKIAAKKIRIVKELSFEEMVAAIKNFDYKKMLAGENSQSSSVSSSDGVRSSYGVSSSYGVRSSDGVSSSYGVLKSFGVHKSLFVANRKMKPKIFKTKVSEERFDVVMAELKNKVGSWSPTFNNLRALYLANGGVWKKVPVQNAAEISRDEAWADMPKAAIEYLKSLPEFHAELFEEITGHKV